MLRSIRYLLVLLVGLAVGSPALAQSEFADTEFDFAGEWTDYGPYVVPADAQNADFTFQRQPTGGNPAAYGELILTRATVPSGDTATWVAVINDNLVWDPGDAQSGPIGHLDFRIDGRRPPATGSRVLTLAVRQAGFVWLALARRVLWNDDGWIAFTIDNLTEQDFVILPGSDAVVDGQPANPDFSASGAPIAFGMGTGLSCPSTSNCSVTAARGTDVDNLLVTVMPPVNVNAAVSDSWYELETAGQGFFIIVFPDLRQIFLAWFTYDTERPPDDVTALIGESGHRWLTAQGPYEGDSAILDVYLTEGGVFDLAEPPAKTRPEPVGEITIKWFDCNDALLVYDLETPGIAGSIDLTRITLDNVALCETLSFGQ